MHSLLADILGARAKQRLSVSTLTARDCCSTNLQAKLKNDMAGLTFLLHSPTPLFA